MTIRKTHRYGLTWGIHFGPIEIKSLNILAYDTSIKVGTFYSKQDLIMALKEKIKELEDIE